MPPKRAPTTTATGIPAGLSWPRFMSTFSAQERAKGKAPTQTAISRAWRAYSGKTSPSRKVSTARKTPKKTSTARKSPKKATSPPMSPMSKFNETERYTSDDALFGEMVPRDGPAKTLEGEILRAANRIAYRWYNDGDGADSDTVSDAYRFLSHVGFTPIPEVEEGDNDDVNYSRYVDALVRAAEENARSKKGRYTPFSGDMYDPKSWKNGIGSRPLSPPAPKAASPRKSPTKKKTSAKKPTTKKAERYEMDHTLFEQLVPQSGPAKTLEGEILRAVNKVAYRWYNDGDDADSEDARQPYEFLDWIGFNKMPYASEFEIKKDYNTYVDALAKRADEYVRSKGGKYTPFSGDMYNSKSWGPYDDKAK